MKEIKRITINGEEYPISFGLNQTILYCEKRDISVNEYNEQLAKLADGSGSELRDLIWSALKDGARRAKEEFKLDEYDVGDMLEEMSAEDINSIIEIMVGTMPDTKAKDTDKKKVVKSSPSKS